MTTSLKEIRFPILLYITLLFFQKKKYCPDSLLIKLFLIGLIAIGHGNTCFGQIDSSKFQSYREKYHNFRSSNADSAEHYVKRLDSISKSYPLSSQRYVYYDILGGWHTQTRNIKEAKASYDKALVIANHLNHRESIVLTKFNIATKMGDGGDLKGAIKAFKEIEPILTEGKLDSRIRIAMYGNLTLFSLSLEDFSQATHYNNLMKNYLTTYIDSVRHSFTSMNILSAQKKYNETLNVGLEILKKIKKDDYHSQISAYVYIGMAYLRSGSINIAKLHFDKAKNLASKSGISNINLEYGLGEVAYEQEDYSQALKHFRVVQQSAEKNKDARLLSTILPKLEETYQKLGNYKKAFEQQKIEIALKDSMAGIENLKYVAELEAKYELNQLGIKLKEQEKINFLQQQSLELKEKWRLSLIILLIGSLIFLGFAFYSIKKIHTYNKRIIDQQHKINIHLNQLEELNLIKDRSLDLISKELQGPIADYYNLLSQETQNKVSEHTFGSLSNIQLTIKNLLDWSNFQKNDKDPLISEVNVGSLLDSILQQLIPLANTKSIHIISFPTHLITLSTNENYLHIALRNLLTNAIKFTSPGGWIKVNIEETHNEFKISIKDSGIGISEQDMLGIFNFPKSKNGTIGELGSGLGLSLSKEMIEKVSGEIIAKSELGIGSEFTIVLPHQA